MLCLLLPQTAWSKSGALLDLTGKTSMLDGQALPHARFADALAGHRWIIVRRPYASKAGAWCQLRSRLNMEFDLGVTSMDGRIWVVASTQGVGPFRQLSVSVDESRPVAFTPQFDSLLFGSVDAGQAEQLVRAFQAGRSAVLTVQPEHGAARQQALSLMGFTAAFKRLQQCSDASSQS